MRKNLEDQYADAQIAYADAAAQAQQELDSLREDANARLAEAELSYLQMQSDAQSAIDTAKQISGAVNALCGNSGNCGSLGMGFNSPPTIDFDSSDYAWEIPTVDPPTLGIDASLPDLSGGKTLDEIQAQVHARAWG